jgi:hypothetical protein
MSQAVYIISWQPIGTLLSGPTRSRRDTRFSAQWAADHPVPWLSSIEKLSQSMAFAAPLKD